MIQRPVLFNRVIRYNDQLTRMVVPVHFFELLKLSLMNRAPQLLCKQYKGGVDLRSYGREVHAMIKAFALSFRVGTFCQYFPRVRGKVDTFELGPAVLEAVARREVLKETGVPIEVGLRYVCSASFRAQDGRAVINVVFEATITDASPTTPQASEVSFAKWLPLRDVLSHPDLPVWTAAYIRQAFPEIRAE